MPQLRPEQLAQVGQPDLAPADRQRRRCRRRRGICDGAAEPSLRAASQLRRPLPVPHGAGDRHVVELDARGRRSAASARRGSCRRGRRTPAETPGARRRSAAAARRTCPTRCCRAARPRSRDRSRRAARARSARAAGGTPRCRRRSSTPANARNDVERDRRVGGAQPGVRRDDEHAAGGDRIVRVGRPREPPRVGELAAEVEAADEAEDVAERRARRRRAAAAPARTARSAT